jgi:hypothetical protein
MTDILNKLPWEIKQTLHAALANAGYKPQPISPENFIAKYLSS